ncbi:hypothetical protein N7532_009430 [Penicillium argentinense]|uniref:Wax synthase domain-containing protein n=1 Tax=Penicillium argentinense TaxID=1131581 RepID=A0A9W9EZF7_9EURO|nr:uncharacterized protein N7532_009430 [Penicillium argentinense]KAJ5090746.1 hypothetical protein N7532_009430 [Penicillium argentinense]
MFLALVSATSGSFSVFVACVALNTSQPNRLYFCLPIVLCGAIGFLASKELDDILPGLGQLWGHAIVSHVIHNTAVLYIDKWTLQPSHERQGWDIHAAYKICVNPQLLGTHQEVPHARPVSTSPSRFAFLRKRLGQLLVLQVLNEFVITPAYILSFAPISAEDFSPTKMVYFRRLLLGPSVTKFETMLRAAFSVRWIWDNYIGLCYAQTALAILFSVILHWDEPWEWRPFFGSPLEAWNMRRFWGIFWHRLVYRPYTKWGLWFSRKVLRIPYGSRAEKASVVMLVFLLSGAIHALVTWHATGCGYWGDIQWFLLNGFVVAGETIVVKPLSRCFSTEENRARRVLWFRLAGYVWVFTFLFWSVPKWEYGKIYCGLSKSRVV